VLSGAGAKDELRRAHTHDPNGRLNQIRLAIAASQWAAPTCCGAMHVVRFLKFAYRQTRPICGPKKPRRRWSADQQQTKPYPHEHRTKGRSHNDGCLYHQRQTHERRCQRRHAASVDRSRTSQAHWYEIRLWRRTMRRLHRPPRRQSRALVPDAALRSRRQKGDNHRRPVADFKPSPAESLDRRASPPMRLLPVRADHAGGGTAGEKPETETRADRRSYERQYLPLRHLSTHRSRH